MANKYLNDTGLQYFYNKLKTIFQAQETGKGLSTNDYTTNEKNKLSGISNGAQVNVIETVKKNGTALTVTSKAVDVSVPTKTSELTNDSDFVEDDSYVHTDNNYTGDEKTKLAGIAAGAEVNQNAFSSVKMKQNPSASSPWSSINSNGKSDILYFIAGNNISLIPSLAENSRQGVQINASWPTQMTAEEASAGTITYSRTISPKVLHDAIAEAVGEITTMSYQIVEELPATGSTGVIYLISHGPETMNVYDEYIWIGSTFEMIGSTAVDLSGYMKTTDMVAITTAEIDSLFA